MKRSTSDALISFLQGIFWAFIFIGAWIIFHILSVFGIGLAIFSVFIFIFFSLIAQLLLETMRLNHQKADEALKQTRLLQEIRDELRKDSRTLNLGQ